jgi:hypothetical protein
MINNEVSVNSAPDHQVLRSTLMPSPTRLPLPPFSSHKQNLTVSKLSLGCLPEDVRLIYIIRGLILDSRMEFMVVYLQRRNFYWIAFMYYLAACHASCYGFEIVV